MSDDLDYKKSHVSVFIQLSLGTEKQSDGATYLCIFDLTQIFSAKYSTLNIIFIIEENF